jgi:hypothetical protein
MDYLQLLKGLKNEWLTKGREKYKSMNIVGRIFFTLFFLPWRISFFFARLTYWFTWFFYRALSAPVDYLESWIKNEKEGLGQAPAAVLYWVTMPFIFMQKVFLAFNAFAFFFQWFGLMLTAFIMTLGAVRWQPVISDATFDE